VASQESEREREREREREARTFILPLAGRIARTLFPDGFELIKPNRPLPYYLSPETQVPKHFEWAIAIESLPQPPRGSITNEFWLALNALAKAYDEEGLTPEERAESILNQFATLPPTVRRTVLEDLRRMATQLPHLFLAARGQAQEPDTRSRDSAAG
jgi:hypothetical protein